MKSLTVLTSAVSLIYRPRPKHMVIAPPPVQELNSVEHWFESQAHSLKLMAPIPDLSTVKDVLQRNLSARVHRFSRHIEDRENAKNWLQIILKSGELIQLLPSPEQSITIAVNCSGNLKLAQEQLALVRSPEFCAARRELGIDRYWFLVIPGYPLQVPKQSELLDVLYAQVSKDEECAVVQFGVEE
jgi:hypothetical protein